MAKSQVDMGVWNELWPRTLIEAYMATGKYSEALAIYEKAISRFGDSIRMRLLGLRVYRMNNQPQKAKEQIEYLDNLLTRFPMRFNSRSDLVPLGEYFLARGEDPKQVLKICYDQAIKYDAKSPEPHVATARMALDKNDDKVASQSLAKAVVLDEADPEIHYLLSRAWSSTDPEKSTIAILRSLEINPHYAPSLLMQAESRMSAEDYAAAEKLLDQVQKTNPSMPKVWALRAAIAHLQGKFQDEGECRRKALVPWALNPEVDHLIGKHLSMHYRFAESVDYQRRALQMDADYVPAKAQLAQDLLRLGDTAPGWTLVDEVRKSDPYDVTIFNLKQLQSQLDKFATLEAPGLVIRMDAREAKIYGKEVVSLLGQARTELTQKYQAKLVEPIYVEIFPRQKEFAIRTFGLPGGEGFLGVCFGRLITANSPAALKVDSNWKSVLWHEYCHVVTLQKTNNKMPRWLSEGISVYEERQKNPIWGQSMDATYRSMILGEDFVPMSKLSSAFLQPKTPMHLQFAYYEASLAIEYWVQEYGMKGLIKLLDDLAVGMPPDEALKRLPGSLDALDSQFSEFARNYASEFGKGIDFTKPTKEESKDMTAWTEAHPKSYWALRSRASALIQGRKFEEALPLVESLRDMLPEDHASDGVYAMLAGVYRSLNKQDQERSSLVALADRCADCRDALMRLIEIDSQANDWKSVANWCDRMVEIDPLRSDVQLQRARASEQVNSYEKAAESLLALLEMDPEDPARVHFRLAVALHQSNQLQEARRHVLMALEESPRYRDALRLLESIGRSDEADVGQPQSELRRELPK
jgi:tetratricopeptide (TPR) repeat protein